MAFGISIQLTHTGTTRGSLFISDIEDGSDTNPLFRRDGRCYIPAPVNGVATPVELVYSTNVARSFEGGVIRKFMQQGLMTAVMILGTEVPVTPGGTVTRFTIPAAPNTTISETYIQTRDDQTATALWLTTSTTPSTPGDYTLEVLKGVTSLTTYDLKTLAPNTPVKITLNTPLDEGDTITLTFTSNNVTLTVTGLTAQLVVL